MESHDPTTARGRGLPVRPSRTQPCAPKPRHLRRPWGASRTHQVPTRTHRARVQTGAQPANTLHRAPAQPRTRSHPPPPPLRGQGWGLPGEGRGPGIRLRRRHRAGCGLRTPDRVSLGRGRAGPGSTPRGTTTRGRCWQTARGFASTSPRVHGLERSRASPAPEPLIPQTRGPLLPGKSPRRPLPPAPAPPGHGLPPDAGGAPARGGRRVSR